MNAESSSRQYSSPLRERQALQTRDLILDALTELLDVRNAHEVTVREVADAAGVSERTVYRHFADRNALHAGLSARLGEFTPSVEGADELSTVEDLQHIAVRLMQVLEQHRVEATAEALYNADPRQYSAGTLSHSADFQAVVAWEFPDLSSDDHRRVTAVIRCLLSSQSWLRMREEFGLQGEESGPMVAWAIGAIFRELDQGTLPDRVAAKTDSDPPHPVDAP